ncbi:MAG: antibiotic biosynthesis monooxygenase [Marinilabiliales bacterium]|nr:antibiotic biosynthesis monooxygenase [Marinilabiliales bacterium]
MKKVIVARITVKPEAVEQFLDYTQPIIAGSNQEEGCLVYKLYREVADPASFVFYEVYVNQEAIDFHNATPHFTTFIENISGILAESPQIEVF